MKSNATLLIRKSLLLPVIAVFSLLLATQASASETANPANDANPRVLMSTSLGKIVIELDRAKAPKTVENFLAYVGDQFYDGTIYHRVIDGFMIQGGGFTADYQRKDTRDPIRNEANNGLKNNRYTISMARTNAPHSATSQFFINTEDNRSLDHTGATARGWGYAVFGRVIEGIDVVKTISTSVTGPGGPFSRDAPQTQVVIEKVELVKHPAEGALESSGDSVKVSQ